MRQMCPLSRRDGEDRCYAREREFKASYSCHSGPRPGHGSDEHLRAGAGGDESGTFRHAVLARGMGSGGGQVVLCLDDKGLICHLVKNRKRE